MSTHSFPYRLSALVSLTLSLAAPACVYPKVLGDDPTATDGSTTDGPATATTDGPATTGAPLVCENPNFQCTQPVDCEKWRCGEIDSTFDANGCLRPLCAQTPCDAGEVCFTAQATPECPAVTCADDGDQCACEVAPDCAVSYCIPADEGPPAECPAITDEAACLAAGCSQFTTVSRYTMNGNGECVVDSVGPACLWFPSDAWGGAATPGAFYEKSTGLAVQFGTDWVEPPYGWGDCGDADAPPACGCFGFCADQQKAAAEFLDMAPPCVDASDCTLADAFCYEGNVCGSVGVHKDAAAEWNNYESDLEAFQCCAGVDPCGASVACENQRCVATFP